MIGRTFKTLGLSCAALTMMSANHAVAQKAKPADPKPLGDYRSTGSSIRQAADKIQGNDLRRMIRLFSNCVYNRSPAKVDTFLRNSDNFGMSPKIGDIVRYLPLSTCMGEAGDDKFDQVGASFSVSSFRDWLAERAYVAANPSLMPAPTDASPPQPRVYFSEGLQLMRAQSYGRLSDCMVAMDRVSSDRLVRTTWGSDEEQTAARALAPALGQCIEEGETFTLQPENIRGLAAQGLWQWREGGKPTASKGKR